jgi:hypothetical protein
MTDYSSSLSRIKIFPLPAAFPGCQPEAQGASDLYPLLGIDAEKSYARSPRHPVTPILFTNVLITCWCHERKGLITLLLLRDIL